MNRYNARSRLRQTASKYKKRFVSVKGYIKGKTIILEDTLPAELTEGEQVEVIIMPLTKKKYNFPTFKLGIKDESLKREIIYEHD